MLKTKVVEKQKNMFETVVEEDGKTVWDKKNGDIRKAILDTVGAEYKQLNYATDFVVAMFEAIIKDYPQLASDPRIQAGMTKYNEIRTVRGL